MADTLYPRMTRQTVERRRALAPDAEDAFRDFGRAVFAEGTLDGRAILKQNRR